MEYSGHKEEHNVFRIKVDFWGDNEMLTKPPYKTTCGASARRRKKWNFEVGGWLSRGARWSVSLGGEVLSKETDFSVFVLSVSSARETLSRLSKIRPRKEKTVRILL